MVPTVIFALPVTIAQQRWILGIIACVPIVISACSKAAADTGISLGGTSIIIVVGVAIETVQALESQMLMRHYKGFLE